MVVADAAAAAAALIALESFPLERLRASAAGRSWATTVSGGGAGYDRLACEVREMSAA
jgi:hypothetical protein